MAVAVSANIAISSYTSYTLAHILHLPMLQSSFRCNDYYGYYFLIGYFDGDTHTYTRTYSGQAHFSPLDVGYYKPPAIKITWMAIYIDIVETKTHHNSTVCIKKLCFHQQATYSGGQYRAYTELAFITFNNDVLITLLLFPLPSEHGIKRKRNVRFFVHCIDDLRLLVLLYKPSSNENLIQILNRFSATRTVVYVHSFIYSVVRLVCIMYANISCFMSVCVCVCILVDE